MMAQHQALQQLTTNQKYAEISEDVTRICVTTWTNKYALILNHIIKNVCLLFK